MSAPGRPKSEFRSAQHEGTPVSLRLAARQAARRLALAVLLAAVGAGAVLAAPPAAATTACPPPLAQPTRGEQAPKDRGLLWRATRDGRTIHLFGTLHVGKPHWRALGPVTRAALRDSEVLALELDPSDPALRQALQDLRPPQPLPEPLQQRLAGAFERACLAADALATLHPLLQATTLTMLEARWLGLDTGHAMEHVLLAQGREHGLRVVALESAATQIRALVPDDEAESRVLLAQSLQQLEDRSARRVLGRLAAAWERGDLAALADYERWCECAATEADRHWLRQLNDERNGPLADGIDKLHAQGERAFVAVGALHFTGPQSLPRLLQARGFKVERMPFQR